MVNEKNTVAVRRRPLSSGLHPFILFAAMLAATNLAGCQDGEARVPKANDTGNLRGIARVYAMVNRDLGRPPKNVEELKAILAPAMADPSSAFRSQRDGQDYVIVWGLDMVGRDLNTPAILAYERTGVDGKRMLVRCNGEVTEVTEQEFAKLKFPKGHKLGGA